MSDNFKATGRQSLYHTGDPTYLKEFLDAYPENLKMYFLYEGDKVVGAHVIGEYKGKFTLWLGSATGHYNEYMLWELMKLEKSLGTRIFEIPGADVEAGAALQVQVQPGAGAQVLREQERHPGHHRRVDLQPRRQGLDLTLWTRTGAQRTPWHTVQAINQFHYVHGFLVSLLLHCICCAHWSIVTIVSLLFCFNQIYAFFTD